MQPLAAGKGLRITAVRERGLRVVTDPEKLELILQNVLSNAIKYTEKGGVSLTAAAQRKNLHRVTDTRHRHPEDNKELIFRRFYRETKPCIGLGLAIVKRAMLDVMGGSIEVESAEGKGTTFRIWLPDNH